MLNALDGKRMTDTFADLLGIATGSRINLHSIEEIIGDCDFARELDAGNSKILVTKTYHELFKDLFGDIFIAADFDALFEEARSPAEYKIFAGAGWAYMQLYLQFQKPISYVMFVLGMKKIANLYPVYHEMDITQLFDYFETEINTCTILKRIMQRRKISAPKLSSLSGVSINTINYYKKSDDNLYKAKFQNIYKLSLALRVTPGLFWREGVCSCNKFVVLLVSSAMKMVF